MFEADSGTTGRTRPVGHLGQFQQVFDKRLMASCNGARAIEHLMRPVRQVGIDSVINPLTLASICHDTDVTQCREVARYLGLYYAERMDEFAYT